MPMQMEGVKFLSVGDNAPADMTVHGDVKCWRVAHIGIAIEAIEILGEAGNIGLIEIVDKEANLLIHSGSRGVGNGKHTKESQLNIIFHQIILGQGVIMVGPRADRTGYS